ncbi:NAD-binding protein [Pleurotus eryngii]|uniref:NAD-binding protein n=1 Tax=Pleurotus eryngii TaxID=5323 RepID=A0A9P6DEI7_PLEER|nr:NAD-binding protein [Pleurotus eryngii]
MPADVDAATPPASPPRRVAIITGAARGIGQSIAARLVTDGLSVIVNDVASKSSELEAVVKRLNEQASSAYPGDANNIVARSIIGDVSKEEDVENMINEAVQVFGRLDVMVANAGIAGPASTIMDAKVEEWEALLSVNLRGVLLCYKHAARQMVKQNIQHGRIIGACSMAGLRGNPKQGAYCASKSAVRSITQTLAMELSDCSITVNAYAPGIIETDLTRTKHDEELGGACALVKKIYGVPNAKVASPDVVASLVSYLVKPEAYFITGQIISLDGGLIGPMQ